MGLTNQKQHTIPIEAKDTKLTPQERISAFALYLGQEMILEIDTELEKGTIKVTSHLRLLGLNIDEIVHGKCILLLKPLSAISSEECTELARLMNFAQPTAGMGRAIVNDFIAGNEIFSRGVTEMDMIAFTDYLRSKGYCLPYLGYNLVAEGIAKLVQP